MTAITKTASLGAIYSSHNNDNYANGIIVDEKTTRIGDTCCNNNNNNTNKNNNSCRKVLETNGPCSQTIIITPAKTTTMKRPPAESSDDNEHHDNDWNGSIFCQSLCFIGSILLHGFLQESYSKFYMPSLGSCYFEYQYEISLASKVLEIVICCCLEQQLWHKLRWFRFRRDTLKMGFPSLFNAISSILWSRGVTYLSVALHRVIFYEGKYLIVAMLSTFLIQESKLTLQRWLSIILFGTCRCIFVLHALQASTDVFGRSHNVILGVFYSLLACVFHGLAFVLLERFIKPSQQQHSIEHQQYQQHQPPLPSSSTSVTGDFIITSFSPTSPRAIPTRSYAFKRRRNYDIETTFVNQTAGKTNDPTEQLQNQQEEEYPSLWIRNIQYAMFSILIVAIQALFFKNVDYNSMVDRSCTFEPRMITMVVIEAIMGLLTMLILFPFGAVTKELGFDFGSTFFLLFFHDGFFLDFVYALCLFGAFFSLVSFMWPMKNIVHTSELPPDDVDDNYVTNETELSVQQQQQPQQKQRKQNRMVGIKKWHLSAPLLEEKKLPSSPSSSSSSSTSLEYKI